LPSVVGVVVVVVGTAGTSPDDATEPPPEPATRMHDATRSEAAVAKKADTKLDMMNPPSEIGN
jgi:sugar phosphate isomerase/epimerase